MKMYERPQVGRRGGTWANGQFLSFAISITFVFIVPGILWELGSTSPQPLPSDDNFTSATPTNYTPNPRLATVQAYHRARRQVSFPEKDPYQAKIQIIAYSDHTTIVSFDLCNVIDCGENSQAYRGYDIYLCALRGHPTDLALNRWCGSWTQVLWNTGPRGYTHIYNAQTHLGQLQRNITFNRRITSPGSPDNSLLMTLRHLHYKKLTRRAALTGPFYFVLGVDMTGADPMAIVRVDVRPSSPRAQFSPSPSDNSTTNPIKSPSESTAPLPSPSSSPVVQYYDANTVEDVVEIETGYTDENMWLKWVYFTARSQNLTDCIVCSQPRPTLTTTPAPLLVDSDRPGFDCMYGLHMGASPANCSTLSLLFPPAPNNTLPPIFTPVKGNYTCLTKQGSTSHRDVGSMPSSWCSRNINVTDWHNATQLEWARSDLFWYCGGKRLRNRLPSNWKGSCTLNWPCPFLSSLPAQNNPLAPANEEQQILT